MRHGSSFRKVYGAATVLAAITIVGLLFALFGDGLWDVISWGLLVLPLVVLLWKIAGRQKSTNTN